MNINKNKVIALTIFVFLFLVPFRLCFFTDEIVSGAKFIGLFMSVVIGFLIAFRIGTNEPFGKKTSEEKVKSNISERRKAA